MTTIHTLKNILFATTLICVTACSDNTENVPTVDETFNAQILNDFSEKVAQSSYNDLKNKSNQLYTNIIALNENKTNDNLALCRASWKEARKAWEQTESFLFGPVFTEDIDPRIDTWPVNFEDLEGQLTSKNEFTQAYVNDLDEALKGFHPIEYLVFGNSGDKKASELSAREMEYLTALGLNLVSLTTKVADSWSATAGNYHATFVGAPQKENFSQIVSAMANICGEVADGKIGEVYVAQDPTLEESPYAKNSIADFTDNIKGVENVYLAKYASDGKGLEDLVKKHNLSLDSEIKAKVGAAIDALNKITVPFGEAITTQPLQVKNAINAINDLKETLEEKLLPFVQVHAK